MRGQAHRLGRLFVIGGGAALGALHLVVLLRRVLDGTLLEPLVLVQWLVGFALIAAAAWLRRRGVSVARGRAAAAFWIAVVLMHGIVAVPGAPGPVGVLTTLPVSDTLPLGAGLIVGALAALTGLLGRHFGAPSARLAVAAAPDDELPVSRPLSRPAARAPPLPA